MRYLRMALAIPILLVLGCSTPQIETVKLNKKNPTSFVFPKTSGEVEAAIIKAFSEFDYRGMSLEILPDHRGAHLYTFHGKN